MNSELLNTYPKYDSYKDSRVDWLGDIPEHWNVLPLDVISKIKSISGYPNETLLSVYLNEGVIRYNDVKEKRTNATSTNLDNYQLVDTGDFVLNNQQAWRGSVGVSSYRGIVSPAYIILELSKSLESNFANYIFRSEHMIYQYVIHSKGVGTIQRNLYWQSFKKSICLIPPISEQTAIANFLDQKTIQIDQAIDLKQQQIERLNEYKQIIIQNAVTKGLDPTAKMKDSGVSWIGNIPEEWTIEKGKWLFFKMDRPVREKDGIVTCFRDGEVTLRSNRRTEGFTNALKEHGYQGVRKGDLVIHQMDAFAGAIGVSDSDGKSTPVYSVCIPKDSKRVLSKYYSYFLRSIAHNGYILSLAKGIRERSTDFRFNDFAKLELPLPPYSSQIKISEFIEQQTARINLVTDLQKQQIERLKEYKTILINQAVTGKIKVS